MSLSRGASTGALQRYMTRLQARLQIGSAYMRLDPESWKSIAAGDC